MKKEDYIEYKKIMFGLGDYYNTNVPESLLTIYWSDFKEYSIDQFDKAVSDHRKDPDQGMFFPKTANLIKQLHGTGKDQHRSIESMAELAWSDVMAFVRIHGVYADYKTSDRVAMMALKSLGGLVKIGNTDYDKQPFLKREFISLYDTFIGTPEEKLPENLLGLSSQTNLMIEQKKNFSGLLERVQEKIEETKLSEQERQEIGQANGAEIRKLLGMKSRQEPEIKKTNSESRVSMSISNDIDQERERRMAALEEAKRKLKK